MLNKINKISNFIEEFLEKTSTNNQLPILSSTMSGIFIQGEYFNRQTASDDTTGYKVVPRGYFTYRSMSDTGGFTFNQQNVVEKGIVSPAYPVFKIVNMDEKFFYYFVNNGKFFLRQLNDIKQGGTRFALPLSRFSDLKISYPDLTKQKEIGEFLSAIDLVIDTYNKVISKTELLIHHYKKTFLPIDSESNDFSKHILNTSLTISKARNKVNKYSQKDVLSVSQKLGLVNQIAHLGRSYAASDVSNYKIVEPGDLVYTKSPLKDFPFGIFKLSKIYGIVSPLYAVYKSQNTIVSKLISFYFSQKSHLNFYLNDKVNKGAKNTMNITDEKAINGSINLPNKPSNQIRIINFLEALEDKVKKHENYLEQLLMFKKFYLNKIFAEQEGNS